MKHLRTLWATLFPKPCRPVIINFADYGDELTFDELAAALRGRSSDVALKAVMQILFHKLDNYRQHELNPTAPASVRDYGAGGTTCAEDMLNKLFLLMNNHADDHALDALARRFPNKKSEKQD